MNEIEKAKIEINNSNLNQAITILKKILKSHPKDIETNYLLALSLELANDYEKAINQYKLTNKIKEGSIIYTRLANIYLKKNNYNLAQINYEKSLKLDNADSKTHNNYALLLILINLEKKSIYHFKMAMKLDPNYMDAKYNFLEINEKMNNLHNLKEYISKLIFSYPNDKIIRFYNTLILQSNKLFQQANKELKKIHFTKKEAKWEVRRLSLLGQTNHNLKKYKMAFDYYKQSNDFFKKNFCYNLLSKNTYLNRINTYLSSTNKKNDTTQKIINKNIGSLVFLVGFPRSGTTLLDSILNSHAKINVIEEKPMLYNSIKHLSEPEHMNVSENKINTIQQNYLMELKKNISDTKIKNTIIVDKMPLNLIFINTINKVFPKSKIILCIRHPLDCILSCFFQNFQINEAMINFLDLQNAANLYDKSMQLMNNNQKIHKTKLHKIKYEDLINNFESETKKIISFLNIKWDNNIFKFYENANKKQRIRTASYNQVIKPIYQESKYKWKNYKNQLSEVIPLIQKWIDFYKYK